MFGAIAGDIAGSTYEFYGMTGGEKEFIPERSAFTDDSILTIAVADAIMSGTPFAEALRTYGTLYPQPKGGYGNMFVSWLLRAHLTGQTPPPYNSYGNGSAMRVSACAWAADSLQDAIDLAHRSAECTHNHPEGIKGAEATAAAIFLARKGAGKEEIREYIHTHYYDMSRTLDDLYNAPYRFGAHCQDTVPEAILSFLYSADYKSAVTLSMLTNKDCDTAAAICGAIAGAYYGVPEDVIAKVRQLLDENLLSVVDEFDKRYGQEVSGTAKPAYNSFQVDEDRIWACEYPFALDEEEGKMKLKTAIDFGITHFIDLTEEGELVPYEQFIPEESHISHMRFPIPDTGVPLSIDDMFALLEKIDSILSNPNAKIYLHCWGGVGRTCTVVACWTAWKQGTGFIETLNHLDRLWSLCPKSERRGTPDSQQQIDFIQAFVGYLKARQS